MSQEFADATKFLARLSQKPTLDAETYHAEALARLTVRGVRSNQVLHRLEVAAALAPTDPRIAADLLAVRLAHVEGGPSGGRAQSQGARQVLRAVAEAVRLARVAAEEPAVWFNYALVFESVGLPATAARGWQRFLELEPDGDWAGEARRQLALAATSPSHAADPPGDAADLDEWAEAHPLAARTHLERTLLVDWAADPTGPEGLAALARARAVAPVVARRFADSTIAETLARLRHGSVSYAHHARGFARYFAGIEATRSQRYTDALDAFRDSAGDLGELPFAGWAEYGIARSLYGLDRSEEALERLRALDVDPAGQEVLEARRLWLLGLVEAALGRLQASVVLTEQALGILIHHPDVPAIASINLNLASPLDQLSQPDRAWYHRLEALRTSSLLPDDYRLRHVALYDAATRLVELGEPEAALPFLVELSANAVAWDAASKEGNATARVEAALLHASALAAAGRHKEAAARLELAVIAAGELRDANRVERLGADLGVESAEVLLVGDPAAALEELDRALEVYRRFGYRYPLVRVHRLRGLAAERLGRKDEVEAAYREAVDVHEGVLASLESPEHRAGYFAHARDAYDSLLRHLAVGRADAEGSFAVLERSRRVWSAADAESTAGSLRDLRSRLAPDSAFVAYRVLADEILVWWVEEGEPELLVLPANREEIVLEVARHEAEMQLAEAPTGADSATARLSRLLLGPLGERLRRVRRLAVLPDRLINRVAFAALADPVQGRLLLDALGAVTILPSAQIASAPDAAIATSIVSVGDPAFDRAAFPDLDPLPAARREALEVADLYPASVSLIGEEAASARIQEELRGRSALHYAGHAVFDPMSPERSGLLLAPAAGDDGVLTVGELGELSLAGLDLVVLSACRTAGDERSSSQDWADALLAAGVRGVVANRWEVEDESARRLVLRFHRHRLAGLSDAEALFAAQRDLRDEPPRVWAGFTYFRPID